MVTQEITGTGIIVIWGLFGVLGIFLAIFRKQVIRNWQYKILRKMSGENKIANKVMDFQLKVGEIIMLVGGIGMTILMSILIILEIMK